MLTKRYRIVRIQDPTMVRDEFQIQVKTLFGGWDNLAYRLTKADYIKMKWCVFDAHCAFYSFEEAVKALETYLDQPRLERERNKRSKQLIEGEWIQIGHRWWRSWRRDCGNDHD